MYMCMDTLWRYPINVERYRSLGWPMRKGDTHKPRRVHYFMYVDVVVHLVYTYPYMHMQMYIYINICVYMYMHMCLHYTLTRLRVHLFT